MPPRKLIRILIVAEVSAFVISCILSSILERTLPEPLRTYAAAPTPNPGILFALMYVSLAAPVLVLAFVSHIGLFFFWRPARVLYLADGIGILVMVVLDGPAVRTGLEGTFDYLAAVFYGSILGLIYFSPFRDLYAKKQPITAVGPTATAPSASDASGNPKSGGDSTSDSSGRGSALNRIA